MSFNIFKSKEERLNEIQEEHRKENRKRYKEDRKLIEENKRRLYLDLLDIGESVDLEPCYSSLSFDDDLLSYNSYRRSYTRIEGGFVYSEKNFETYTIFISYSDFYNDPIIKQYQEEYKWW